MTTSVLIVVSHLMEGRVVEIVRQNSDPEADVVLQTCTGAGQHLMDCVWDGSDLLIREVMAGNP